MIVEAGAHTGTDTAAMARRWRRAQIHAFEPVPDVYDRLEGRTRQFANVYRYSIALAASAGTEQMYVSGGESDGSSSLLAPDDHLRSHPGVRFDQQISVETSTLDEWSASRGVPTVDLLWLDAQGAELDILRGGQGLLPSVTAIYTEVSILANYKGGVLYPELYEYLLTAGFVAVSVQIAWEDGGNALFVRPRP